MIKMEIKFKLKKKKKKRSEKVHIYGGKKEDIFPPILEKKSYINGKIISFFLICERKND